MTTALDTPTIEAPGPDTDGADRVAHIGDQTEIARGYATGCAVRALCGLMFVPRRDPTGLAICPLCALELEHLVTHSSRR